MVSLLPFSLSNAARGGRVAPARWSTVHPAVDWCLALWTSPPPRLQTNIDTLRWCARASPKATNCGSDLNSDPAGVLLLLLLLQIVLSCVCSIGGIRISDDRGKQIGVSVLWWRGKPRAELLIALVADTDLWWHTCHEMWRIWREDNSGSLMKRWCNMLIRIFTSYKAVCCCHPWPVSFFHTKWLCFWKKKGRISFYLVISRNVPVKVTHGYQWVYHWNISTTLTNLFLLFTHSWPPEDESPTLPLIYPYSTIGRIHDPPSMIP